MIKVAIQGIEGAYHEIAAREFFKNEKDLQVIPCETFKDVISEVQKDSGSIGIMAIENTIAGSLLQNHELIRESGLKVFGEKKIRISHCLASLESDTLQDIKEINSHPIALMQCEVFLETLPDVKIVEKTDTAESAKEISDKKLKGHAAICGKFAAELYGLKILAEGIETNKHNFTRFLLVANNLMADEMTKSRLINKASIVFNLPHTEGSLSKVLTILSFYEINLTKIQSLPIIGKEWEYLFYVDLTFNDYTRYLQALDAVRPLTRELKILGEYAENKK